MCLRLSCLEITVTSSKLSGQVYEVAMQELQQVRGNIERAGRPEGIGAPREVASLTSEGAVEVEILPADMIRSKDIPVQAELIPEVALQHPMPPHLAAKGPKFAIKPRGNAWYGHPDHFVPRLAFESSNEKYKVYTQR